MSNNYNPEPPTRISKTSKPHKPNRPRVEGLFAVLRIRERELLKLKGSCDNAKCRLHKDHQGPCDEPKAKKE